jgi:Asp-tRNA(Asn)/Glu-tRNA(Gln) amidotransferase A subunit family amidase
MHGVKQLTGRADKSSPQKLVCPNAPAMLGMVETARRSPLCSPPSTPVRSPPGNCFRSTGSAYLPVTVPPVGFTPSGLPVGIHGVAPSLHDRTALAFARCMAEVVGGYVPPPVAYAEQVG